MKLTLSGTISTSFSGFCLEGLTKSSFKYLHHAANMSREIRENTSFIWGFLGIFIWGTRGRNRKCFFCLLGLLGIIFYLFGAIEGLHFYQRLTTGLALGASRLWTKRQLQILLLACGDVESNPGPTENDSKFDRLRIMQLNANTLTRGRQAEVEKLLFEHCPDVIFIQESNLNATSTCKIRGYHAERLDRQTARGGQGNLIRGGGLITLIKDTDEARQRY